MCCLGTQINGSKPVMSDEESMKFADQAFADSYNRTITTALLIIQSSSIACTILQTNVIRHATSQWRKTGTNNIFSVNELVQIRFSRNVKMPHLEDGAHSPYSQIAQVTRSRPRFDMGYVCPGHRIPSGVLKGGTFEKKNVVVDPGSMPLTSDCRF